MKVGTNVFARALLTLASAWGLSGCSTHGPDTAAQTDARNYVVSFDLCNANTERRTVKAAVRRHFERKGQPYDGELVDTGVDSLLYVMPVRFTDPPVRWFDRYPAGSPRRASP